MPSERHFLLLCPTMTDLTWDSFIAIWLLTTHARRARPRTGTTQRPQMELCTGVQRVPDMCNRI